MDKEGEMTDLERIEAKYEAAPCDVCGYPDPRKLIAKLKEENTKLWAFWEWSRLADKMTFEQYHWIGKKASHEG